MPKKLTQEEFIKRSKETHGNLYNYDKSIYVGAKTKVIITCLTHNEDFLKLPGEHMRGIGCQKCANDNNPCKKWTTQKFIEEAEKVHGKEYDYSEVQYINNHTPVIILCSIHEPFKQRPDHHLNGLGCPGCSIMAGKKRIVPSQEEFLILARERFGEKFDYSRAKYVNRGTYITIGCPVHEWVMQRAGIHLHSKMGCPECAIDEVTKNNTWTIQEFIDRAKIIHNDKYDYSESEYISSIDFITIICPYHNRFQQTPRHHLRGQGCSLCKNKTEAKLYEWFKESYDDVLKQISFDDCVNSETGYRYRFDFKIGNIFIELDGDQHFRQVSKWTNPEENLRRDIEKMKYLLENKYNIIRIKQTDVWKNKINWKSILKNLINIISSSEKEGVYYIGDKYDLHKKYMLEC